MWPGVVPGEPQGPEGDWSLGHWLPGYLLQSLRRKHPTSSLCPKEYSFGWARSGMEASVWRARIRLSTQPGTLEAAFMLLEPATIQW